MKLPEDHFLKGLGCHGLLDAYLPPVCYFANCSHYRERLKQESWESCEHQSPPCLGNPGCHPRNSRDCVPQGELETNFSRLWSFLCRWVWESPQQPGLAASLALNIKLFWNLKQSRLGWGRGGRWSIWGAQRKNFRIFIQKVGLLWNGRGTSELKTAIQSNAGLWLWCSLYSFTWCFQATPVKRGELHPGVFWEGE